MEDGRVNTATGQLMLGAFDTSGTPFGGIESGTPYWSNSYPKIRDTSSLFERSSSSDISPRSLKILLFSIALVWLLIAVLGIAKVFG